MCELFDEASINQHFQMQKYECLHEELSQFSTCLECFANIDNRSWDEMKDEHLVLNCKGHCDGSNHTYFCIEKETCCSCNKNACHHWWHVDKDSKHTMCVICCKNKTLNGVSECHGNTLTQW